MNTELSSAWEKLEDSDEKKRDLYERAAANAEEIIEQQKLESSPEILVIGTSELGDDFVETSARGSGSEQTAPEILKGAAENDELVISTGWPEGMFYDFIAPQHGLEQADAVLESGGQIAINEGVQVRTQLTGDKQSLKEVTDSIWKNAVREAAERGYKIHPQGNDVGTAVYVEADPASRGDLANTEQALESAQSYNPQLLLEEIGNEDFRMIDSPVDNSEQAIAFADEEENIVDLYGSWKENFPLLGLRLEKDNGEIIAYEDEKLYRDRNQGSLSEGSQEYATQEVMDYINTITPENAHSTWNNDWNADIIPEAIPSKFEGLQKLAGARDVESAMIYADKTSDFPVELQESGQYGELEVLSVAVSGYSGEDAANEELELEIPNTQEAAYTLGALQSKLD